LKTIDSGLYTSKSDYALVAQEADYALKRTIAQEAE
jgi:hypothetical protein